MDYMQWFKKDVPARLDARISGAPIPEFGELGFSADSLSLKSCGYYGHPDLLARIADLYETSADRVMPVPGANGGIAVAVAACTDPGDIVAVESPAYEPIIQAMRVIGRRCIRVLRDPADGFRLDPVRLERALGEGARAVFVTNHHNPSGNYTSRESMKALADTCGDRRVQLIVDEVYLDAVHLAYGEPRWSSCQFGDHVCAINSLTKLFGFGGLRIGWLVSGAALIEKARRVMDALSVNNAEPSMIIAAHVMSQLGRWEDRFREQYRTARAILDPWLASQNRIERYENHGAVFECLKLPDGMDDLEFCRNLASRFETSVVPGSFFGLPGHVRVGALTPPEILRPALEGIDACLKATG
ncbi:MAG: pyridoxal phosphate-dependent aminotransferase [Planctomycetota bacterium]|jgi:aspartate/methionine/tyrosine aminotransferase